MLCISVSHILFINYFNSCRKKSDRIKRDQTRFGKAKQEQTTSNKIKCDWTNWKTISKNQAGSELSSPDSIKVGKLSMKFYESCLFHARHTPKVPSMSFYPDFILILYWFYLDFIQILSRFIKTHFIQILSRFLKTHFTQILSRFYPNFWKYLDKIWIKCFF